MGPMLVPLPTKIREVARGSVRFPGLERCDKSVTGGGWKKVKDWADQEQLKTAGCP